MAALLRRRTYTKRELQDQFGDTYSSILNQSLPNKFGISPDHRTAKAADLIYRYSLLPIQDMGAENQGNPQTVTRSSETLSSLAAIISLMKNTSAERIAMNRETLKNNPTPTDQSLKIYSEQCDTYLNANPASADLNTFTKSLNELNMLFLALDRHKNSIGLNKHGFLRHTDFRFLPAFRSTKYKSEMQRIRAAALGQLHTFVETHKTGKETKKDLLDLLKKAERMELFALQRNTFSLRKPFTTKAVRDIRDMRKQLLRDQSLECKRYDLHQSRATELKPVQP